MINKIPLLNIANYKRKIYLFTRDEKGEQKIIEDNSFYPFFYEPDNNGLFTGYDGTRLKKVFVSEPSEISTMKSINSYSADIRYTTNYIIHKVDEIIKIPIKYCFLDLEVLAEDMPEDDKAKYSISCISIYNSFSKEITTFYIEEYEGDTILKKEKKLIESFIEYMQKERFDIWLSWNSSFDYNYCYRRISKFAQQISPIKCSRTGEEQSIFYPAGLSVLDYLRLFKKVFMREASYTLDYIGEKHLGRGKIYKKVDFSKLDKIIKLRNIDDVKIMVELEEKYHLIDYYNEIRRMVKCQWEDLYHNSRIVEMLLFDEAKKKNLILPNKVDRENEEETTFEGATRDIDKAGVYLDVSKFDLSSAYPSMIVNFCLDTQNISKTEGININGIKFKQNTDALLPSVIKRMLVTKDFYKKQKKENPSDKNIDTIYAAVKSIANSGFGVFGNKYFRLFDNNIASTITYLVRDVLMYVKDRIEKEGLKVLYHDTDSVFINTKENIKDKLNQFIRDWAREKYNKDSIDLLFDYEGYFTKLLILGSCHYVGYLNNGKKEIKGVEMKRSSSSKFEAKFQEELIDKILNNEQQENILKWIDLQKHVIRNLKLEDIAFPCKIANKEYTGIPIFVRAYNTTRKIKKDFKVSKGELFFYLFMKDGEVLAFKDIDKSFIDINKIDWKEMERRSIVTKTSKIFDAMNWQLRNINQEILF